MGKSASGPNLIFPYSKLNAIGMNFSLDAKGPENYNIFSQGVGFHK